MLCSTNVLTVVSLVATINGLLTWIGRGFGITELTLQLILRYIFYPVTFFMGVPRNEILRVAELLATKLVENEFVAYTELKAITASADPLSDRAYTIASYALCGFANLGSPELKERMNYVNRLEQKRLAAGGAKAPGAKDAGTELYENMCMNAVNQSIGAPKLLVLRRGRESSTSVPVPGCRSRDPTSGGLGRAGARRRPVRFAADTGQVAQVDRGWDCCHGGLRAGYEGARKVRQGEEGRVDGIRVVYFDGMRYALCRI